MTPITLSPPQVSRAVMSFPAGSAGGRDGLHPQHLKDLLRPPSDSNYIRTIELYFFYRFIVHRSVLTAENLIKVKAEQSFKKFRL